jgi:O-antigen ligase
MSHRASRGSVAQRAKAAATSALEWHDARPRATLGMVRGWVWMILIAATFFWMSNPLAYILTFYLALDDAVLWTLVVVVVTLPWLRLPRVPWPWLLFLGLCVASKLWTIYEPQTDVSIVLYVKITALAVVVAANCSAEVVCWGLATGGVVVAGLSVYAFHTNRPGSFYQVLGEDGVIYNALAGIGTNENILAYTLVVSLAAAISIGLPPRPVARAVWMLTLAVLCYGVYVAHSGTGYQTVVALVLASGVAALWPRLVSGRHHRRLVLIASSLVALLLASALVVSALLGAQITTFSGRTVFWKATVTATLERAPVLGSGWGAVWEHPWNPMFPNYVSEDIYERAGYALPHGHNFFIDVLPELGLLGVAVALLMVFYAVAQVRRCGLHLGGTDAVAGRLGLMVLVALLASGITEPMLTVPLGWWSLVLVVAVPRQRELSSRSTPSQHARSNTPDPVPSQ